MMQQVFALVSHVLEDSGRPHWKRDVTYVAIALLLLAFYPVAWSAEREDIDIKIILDQRIAMRDGVELSARIWMPAEIDEPLPTVFVFTPYISDESQKRGTFFARNGYVYVSIDVRGRGNSEGEFNPPGKHHSRDVHDVTAWLAKQPWSDGHVVMRGGSYRGMAQWQAMTEKHEALRSIVPTAASSGRALTGGGVPRLWLASWLGLTSGSTQNRNLSGDSGYWRRKHMQYFHNHVPYSRFWEVAGVDQRIYSQRTLPDFAEYRNALFPSKADYASIDIPTLSITGYWDGAQLAALDYRNRAIRNSSDKSGARHFLVIGPWSHAGTRYPTEEVHGMTVGAKAIVDMERLHLDWYNWVLKDGEKPKLLKDKVTYYVIGPNEWRHVGSLDQTANATRVWHLDSVDGRAHDVFHSGELTPSLPSGHQPDVIKYDPLDTSLADIWPRIPYNVDQKLAYAPGGLIYHSPPLEVDTEVSGFLKVKAFISLDVPDTDLSVSVNEMRPDGTSILVGQDHIRARYRNSVDKVELVTPGEVNLYEFDSFNFSSRVLKKGSRVRLLLRPLNSPYYGKNFNSGGRLGYETATDARIATITLHHDARYKSRLELPVMKR